MSGEIVVAVLAGGRSSRMGSPKADVVVADRPMRGHVLAAVAASGLDAIEVGGAGGIPDLRPVSSGPLAGLEAGLAAAAGRDVIVVAIDQPWVLPDTLAALATATGEAVVPLDRAKPQVTCARYRARCLPVVTRLLDEGRGSVQGLLDEVETILVPERSWRAWGEDGRSWFSADTPDAVAVGLRTFGPPGTLPP